MLRKPEARVRYNGGRWTICIWEKKYHCQIFRKNGKACITAIDLCEDCEQALKREHADIFFNEGDILGVTGNTVHGIPLKQNGMTYVKERSYPQEVRQHIREDLKSQKQ